MNTTLHYFFTKIIVLTVIHLRFPLGLVQLKIRVQILSLAVKYIL